MCVRVCVCVCVCVCVICWTFCKTVLLPTSWFQIFPSYSIMTLNENWELQCLYKTKNMTEAKKGSTNKKRNQKLRGKKTGGRGGVVRWGRKRKKTEMRRGERK